MPTSRLFAVLAVVLALTACKRSFEPPPVEISFRESFVGAGKIVQVTNTSNTVLERVEVRIVAPDGSERTFLQEEIDAYDMLEVGWKKLGGWQVPAGAEVEVNCDGYLGSVSGVLPGEEGES